MTLRAIICVPWVGRASRPPSMMPLFARGRSGFVAPPHPRQRWARQCVVLCVSLLALSACKTEEEVVEYKPFFAGLPGAEGAAESSSTRTRNSSASPAPQTPLGGVEGEGEPLDPSQASADPLVIVNPDGSKTLIIQSIRHVMTHIERRLDEGEEGDKLLLDQVVAQTTKDEFSGSGKDPSQIIDYLHEHQRDIAVLFSRLPFGENTPGVFLDKRARNRFVLKLPPLARKGSNFTELWVELEHGTWKFMWAK